jgi:hypothetical protein
MVGDLATSVQALVNYNAATSVSSTTSITTTAVSSGIASTVTSSASHSIAIRATSIGDFIEGDELLRSETLNLAHEPPSPEKRQTRKRRK